MDVRRIVLRPVRLADSDLVLAWANDPLTRAAGFHPQPIDPEAHAGWYAARLANPDSRTWIGEAGGIPVGQVRADRERDGRVEMGISVAPEARGKGLSKPLLTAGMAAAVEDLGAATLVALVRPENQISLRLFRDVGFVDDGSDERAGIRCLRLIRDVDGTVTARR